MGVLGRGGTCTSAGCGVEPRVLRVGVVGRITSSAGKGVEPRVERLVGVLGRIGTGSSTATSKG